MSEQSASILPLLALALFTGAQAWETVKGYEWPAYSGPSCQMHGKYQGRDESGRPSWDYERSCRDDPN